MGSKANRRGTCVYCAVAEATTKDHVFARAFFMKHQRRDLPVAPACADCNRAKSALELYLATVLPFGGRQKNSSAHLESTAGRMLGRNEKLRRDLCIGASRVWSAEASGFIMPTIAIPFDGDKLHCYLALVVRGLAWAHWSYRLPASTHIDVRSLTPAGEKAYAPIFSLRPGRRIDKDLHGVVAYSGAQAVDGPDLTTWRFRLLNGVTVSDKRVTSSQLIAITQSAENQRRTERLIRAAASLKLANLTFT